jgi:hypothetical protein
MIRYLVLSLGEKCRIQRRDSTAGSATGLLLQTVLRIRYRYTYLTHWSTDRISGFKVGLILSRQLWLADLKCREFKTGSFRKISMQTGYSDTLIGWNPEKTLMSLYGTDWRERGFGLGLWYKTAWGSFCTSRLIEFWPRTSSVTIYLIRFPIGFRVFYIWFPICSLVL